MLIQSHQFITKKIASLHTGRVIDEVGEIIINPFDLEVSGFYLANRTNKILLVGDVREIQRSKLVVNSEDVLSEPDDLYRLQKVLDLNYQLIGNKVLTKSKQKLGNVEEYVIDSLSWKVQKIHVKQPLWRSFTGGLLIIDRRQVLEVSKNIVIVEDAVIPAGKLAAQQISS